jgi:hypothetical protein
VDSDKRRARAVTEFYREEFERYLDSLRAAGILHDQNREVMDLTCRRLMSDLDRVCTRAEFGRIAETLLQNFDTLTRLSEQDTRLLH